MKIKTLLLLMCFMANVNAATVSQTFTPNVSIPDFDETGYADSRSLSNTMIDEITSVTVNLSFVDGWNGDLYVYLTHGTGFSVLLNRPGRSLAQPDGSGTVGMSITLDDNASTDVHTGLPMSGTNPTGTFQPDARNVDPGIVVTGDARTAYLASFQGISANGQWTLFVADLASGGTSTLQSWTLNITGNQAVPEPSVMSLGAILSLIFITRRKR